MLSSVVTETLFFFFLFVFHSNVYISVTMATRQAKNVKVTIIGACKFTDLERTCTVLVQNAVDTISTCRAYRTQCRAFANGVPNSEWHL